MHRFKVRLLDTSTFDSDGIQVEPKSRKATKSQSQRQIPFAKWYVNDVHVATICYHAAHDEDVLHEKCSDVQRLGQLRSFLEILVCASGDEHRPFRCAHYNDSVWFGGSYPSDK